VSADDEEARKAASILWLLRKWNCGVDCKSALCKLSPALPWELEPKQSPFETHAARRMQPLLLAALAVNFNSIYPADACHGEFCAELLTTGCGLAFLHR